MYGRKESVQKRENFLSDRTYTLLGQLLLIDGL